MLPSCIQQFLFHSVAVILSLIICNVNGATSSTDDHVLFKWFENLIDFHYCFVYQVQVNQGSLLFNFMGVGTFIIFFFLVAAVVTWFLSASCTPPEKILTRSIFVFVFMVTALVLVYAPRTASSFTDGYEKTVVKN